MNQPALLFFVTEDWYFHSHRLSLAIAAKNKGYRICVVTNVTAHAELIQQYGFELIPLKLERRSKNPFKELLVIKRLVGIYRRVQPSIVHHVAIKPVLYGSIAASICRIPVIINALAGLGYIYSSRQRLASILRPLVKSALTRLINCRRCHLIVQNPDDRAQLLADGIIDPDKISLIRGSGVDTRLFAESEQPDGIPMVLLPARMLWDKGIAEFVAAARILRQQGIEARFVLAGSTDPHNPATIPRSTLEQWNREGVVEWIGPQADMPALYRQSHIVCLPSYREGLPKTLLEAAASARPIVATDVPGCREIVIQEKNGLLVPAHEAKPLAEALKRLISNEALRDRMGRAGRTIVLESFTEAHVTRATLTLYEKMLSE